MNFREKIIILKKFIKIDCFSNIKILILSFVNVFFVKANKLFIIILSRFYKLRLIDNKLILNITYITLFILTLKNYIKKL